MGGMFIENIIMVLSCIIVDDEPLAVKLLESFVARTPGLELLGSYTDSIEGISAIKEQRPNLLFLDIQMPDLNGMDLAHMLPDCTKIIFTTAFKEYALESYEVNALDFLLKPIRYIKFLNAVNKAKDWFNYHRVKSYFGRQTQNFDSSNSLGESMTIFLKVDGEFRQIPIDDIVYICGMKDYVMFYLENERKPLITYLRMKVVEDMLPKDKFMRVHRSYIVALDKIERIDRNDCIYIKDEIIHVTEAFHDNFHTYLKEHQAIRK